MNPEKFEPKLENPSVPPIKKSKDIEERESSSEQKIESTEETNISPKEEPYKAEDKLELEQARERLKKVTEKQDNEIERAKKRLGKIFNEHKDGAKGIEDILSIVNPILESDLIDGEKIRQSLEQCSTIKDREEFVEKTFSALEPILDLRKKNPEAFEKLQRKSFIEQEKFTPLNEILSYGGNGDLVHIHLAPAKTIGIGEMRRLIKDGFEKLARIVEENKEIKKIAATSWIIAEHPKIMERFGFEVEGEIDEETRQRHFVDDDREIHGAAMTRKEFLSKYLKK
jgi:hypothetical protein